MDTKTIEEVKQEIDQQINNNNAHYIDGSVMNGVLNDMMDAIDEEKADTTGYYEGLSVGLANNLISPDGVEDKDSWLYRSTAGSQDVSSGFANLQSLKGDSIVWNQLKNNGQFEDGTTTGWSCNTNYAKISANNGLGLLTVLSPYYGEILYMSIPSTLQRNNKYYIQLKVRYDDNLPYTTNNVKVGFNAGGSFYWVQEPFLVGKFKNIKSIVSPQNSSSSVFFYLRAYGTISAGDTVSFTDGMCINLNSIFGSDAQIAEALGITVAQITTSVGVSAFESWLSQHVLPREYFPYCAGKLVSFEPTALQTVGFNQYDNSKQTSNVHVLKDNKYTIKGTYTSLKYSDGTDVLTYTEFGNTYFTPDREDYLTLAGGNDTDTCVHLTWSGYRDDALDYEKYWKNNMDLSWIKSLQYSGNTMFPKGLCGIKDIYDEVSTSKAIKRIGHVDLGTQTWTKQGKLYTNESTTTDKFTPVDGSNLMTSAGRAIKFNQLVDSSTESVTLASGKKYITVVNGTWSGTITGTGSSVSVTGGTDMVFDLTTMFGAGNEPSTSAEVGALLGESSYAYNPGSLGIIANSTYASGAAFKTAMDGVDMIYPLSTPAIVEFNPEKQLLYKEDDFGTEEFINTEANVTVPSLCYPREVGIRYQGNLRDEIRRIDQNYVGYDEQSPSLEEQKTARTNIGAVGENGAYPGVTVGNMLSDKETERTFLFEKTGGTGSTDVADGSALIKSIEGNTWRWNQLIGNSTESVTLENGKKYITVVSGTWSGPTTGNGSSISVTGGTDMVFDLTTMFGAGNEPSTVAEFESWLSRNIGLKKYYPYCEGDVISSKMKSLTSVGFNQWDEQWENKIFNTTTYVWDDSSSNIASKNLIPVFPNTTYYFKCPVSTASRKVFYNANGEYLSWGSLSSNNNFTTPDGAYYVKFGMAASYGTTYNNNICINLSKTSRNGEYESYWNDTVDTDWISQVEDTSGNTLFPYGLSRLSNTIYDEVTSSKAIKRVGNLDLGTQTWTKQGNLYTNESGASTDRFTPVDGSNLLTKAGTAVKWNQIVTNDNTSDARGGLQVVKTEYQIAISGTCISDDYNILYVLRNINLIQGHKYYLKLPQISGLSSVFHYICANGFNSSWHYGSHIQTASYSSSTGQVRFQFKGIDTVINITGYIAIFDLTLMFGEGNEPTTVAEFEAFMGGSNMLDYYAYDTGSLGIISNTTYSSASDFKTAMDGVPLYYPLTTPVEVPLTTTHDLDYRVDGDGTEQVTIEQGTSGEVVSVAPTINVTYPTDIRGSLEELDENSISVNTMDSFSGSLSTALSGIFGKTIRIERQSFDEGNNRYDYETV